MCARRGLPRRHRRPVAAVPPRNAIDLGGSRRAPMRSAASSAEWLAVYSRKRVVHQWTQLALLARIDCRHVLEVGPGLGLVTAMLINAGYTVDTLDRVPPRFAQPVVRHIERDLEWLS